MCVSVSALWSHTFWIQCDECDILTILCIAGLATIRNRVTGLRATLLFFLTLLRARHLHQDCVLPPPGHRAERKWNVVISLSYIQIIPLTITDNVRFYIAWTENWGECSCTVYEVLLFLISGPTRHKVQMEATYLLSRFSRGVSSWLAFGFSLLTITFVCGTTLKKKLTYWLVSTCMHSLK